VKSGDRWIRAGVLAGALTGLLLGFFAFVRPWYSSWGADVALGRAYLPGDALIWQGAPPGDLGPAKSIHRHSPRHHPVRCDLGSAWADELVIPATVDAEISLRIPSTTRAMAK
jgi:hypothetical protein